MMSKAKIISTIKSLAMYIPSPLSCSKAMLYGIYQEEYKVSTIMSKSHLFFQGFLKEMTQADGGGS